MSPRFKKIYLFVMVVVPFLLYSGYYYREMIRKAPFKFEEFQTIRVDFKAPDGRQTHIDIAPGTVTVILPEKDTVHDTVRFSNTELNEFHRTLYTNNFFELPHEMRNEGSIDSTTGIYTIEAIYDRKQYQVIYETNYRGDSRHKPKVERVIAYIESNVKKKLEGH
ncbi:MAG TPA: hypothetical protein VIR29_09250 [Anseongella sp.]